MSLCCCISNPNMRGWMMLLISPVPRDRPPLAELEMRRSGEPNIADLSNSVFVPSGATVEENGEVSVCPMSGSVVVMVC